MKGISKVNAFKQAEIWAKSTGQPQNVVRLRDGSYASLPASDNFELQWPGSALVSSMLAP